MGRWFSSRPQYDPATVAAYNEMSFAFLRVDDLVTDIDDGVSTLPDTDASRRIREKWAQLREAHAAITSRYLVLVRPDADSPYAPGSAYAECTHYLNRVGADMNTFREKFSDPIAHARAGRQLAAQARQQARVDANDAVAALDAPDSARFLRYPSVIGATDALAERLTSLDHASGVAAVSEAAEAVREAAQSLHAALRAAPQRGIEAQNSLKSAETRMSAIRTRLEQLAPTWSALRKEFSTPCWNDLINNEREASQSCDVAEAGLESARAVLSSEPETALSTAKSARSHLNQAASLVDAVTERLRQLRDVRADPAGAVTGVRFALRDAQRVAVQLDLVKEWGPLLDAQSSRIDTAIASLETVHPNYWGYLSELASVEKMVANASKRMRGRE